MKSFSAIQKLLKACKGDPVAMGQLADASSGGHMAEFCRTQDELLNEEIDRDVRDGYLGVAKQVQFLSTAMIMVLEIAELLVKDNEAAEALSQRWQKHGGEPPPLRDILTGAARIESAYSSATRPLQRLYVNALRGSYAPEIYEFGFGPELMDVLIQARLVPVDLEVLEDLRAKGGREIALDSIGEELESFERLAAGDCVEMRQVAQGRGKIFIRHRTDAVSPTIKVRITARGRRLLTMISAGQGAAS